MDTLDEILAPKKNEYLAVGLMSGTSADSVDAALVRFMRRDNGFDDQILEFISQPYPKNLRERIMKVFKDEAGSLELACQLNFEIGEVFTKATHRLILASGFPAQAIKVIGSHGQTVYHIPPTPGKGRKPTPSTLQIGESSIIANSSGIPVASDFRPPDIAAGGQGAPLISTADYYLMAHGSKTRILQNIGGIANCTYLPAGGEMGDLIAFDTGPGNMVMDGLMTVFTDGKKTYDKNGNMARSGTPDEKWLKELLKMPYFSRKPPKTTGREMFGYEFVKKMAEEGKKRKLSEKDIMATAGMFTVESIARAYEKFLFRKARPKEIILSGGGSKNRFLVNALKERLPEDMELVTQEKYGVNSKAREAIGFALLGLLCILGLPGNIPAATGAREKVSLGKIYFPLESA